MEGSLVSLVMTAWNARADWLRSAVASALAERDSEIELVLVDDGSDPPVQEMLGDLRDPRVRLIRTGRVGLAAARNAGIEAARGDHVRFIDADDTIEPESTAHLLSLTGGTPDVIPYGAVLFCDEELSPRWTMTSSVQGDAVVPCLLGRFTVRTTAMLLPRAVLERTGPWAADIPASSDWDFVLRAVEHGTVRGSDAVVYRYRRHGGGITGRYERGLEGAGMAIERYFDRHPEQRGTRLERRAQARRLAHAGRVYATHGRIGKGLGQLTRAALMDPSSVATEVWQGRAPVAAMARRRLPGGN